MLDYHINPVPSLSRFGPFRWFWDTTNPLQHLRLGAIPSKLRWITPSPAHPNRFERGYGRTAFDVLHNLDASIVKTIRFGSRRAEIRADFFNALNTPHYANPNGSFGNANFGRVREFWI
jgi:hypothetical protein